MLSSTPMIVLLADQIASRADKDRVPQALSAVSDLDFSLPFERTAGDEIQALTVSPRAVTDAILRLTRVGGWRIGIGVGVVEVPLPSSTRSARGAAYLAGRTAIRAARSAPANLALEVDPGETQLPLPALRRVHDAQSALSLWRHVLSRRSPEGWELDDLLSAGQTRAQAAASLGISSSAVSQRLHFAAREEVSRGAELCAHLLEDVLQSLQPITSAPLSPTASLEKDRDAQP